MARWANVALGVWLIGTGLLVRELSAAPVPQWAVGALIVAAELLAALRWEPARWASFVAGAWLVAAPLLFTYQSGGSTLNSFACGLLVSILASYATHPARYEEPTTYNLEIYGSPERAKPYR